MYSQEFIDEMRQRLVKEKQRLEAEVAGTMEHTEIGDDMDEAASELEIDEVNQDLIVTMKEDIAKIDAALEKMDLGTYGVDDEGKVIGEERLRAIPWADKAI